MKITYRRHSPSNKNPFYVSKITLVDEVDAEEMQDKAADNEIGKGSVFTS